MKICITTFFTIFFLSCNGQTAKDTEIWEPIPKEAYSIRKKTLAIKKF